MPRPQNSLQERVRIRRTAEESLERVHLVAAAAWVEDLFAVLGACDVACELKQGGLKEGRGRRGERTSFSTHRVLREHLVIHVGGEDLRVEVAVVSCVVAYFFHHRNKVNSASAKRSIQRRRQLGVNERRKRGKRGERRERGRRYAPPIKCPKLPCPGVSLPALTSEISSRRSHQSFV